MAVEVGVGVVGVVKVWAAEEEPQRVHVSRADGCVKRRAAVLRVARKRDMSLILSHVKITPTFVSYTRFVWGTAGHQG